MPIAGNNRLIVTIIMLKIKQKSGYMTIFEYKHQDKEHPYCYKN